MKQKEQRKIKHKQAEERKQARAKRTDKQQLQRLDINGRIAKKERARLNKRIDNDK